MLKLMEPSSRPLSGVGVLGDSPPWDQRPRARTQLRPTRRLGPGSISVTQPGRERLIHQARIRRPLLLTCAARLRGGELAITVPPAIAQPVSPVAQLARRVQHD